jgi:diaminopimelate decarboxylase
LLDAAQGFIVSYALKANTNNFVVKLIKESGINHIDVVSPGEIVKALKSGFPPSNILYT